MPATLTEVAGQVYDALGNFVSVGEMTVTLQSDFISVDGTKVVPFVITVDLVATTGSFVKYMYATDHVGIYYIIEYDPDPTDTSKPAKQKDGYFRNRWSVTNDPYLGIGLFPHLN